MENQKHQYWTVEEEKALRDGVAKHGVGKWSIILNDPQFSSSLINRSNIDLKDKWRNLGASTSSSTTLWYKMMIIEALSSTDNANGLDVDAIQSYIEERGDDKTSQLGKRYLRTMLWKLIREEKLEMNVKGRYKIKHYEPNNPHDGANDDDQQIGSEEEGNDEQQTETKEDTNNEQQIETEEDATTFAAYKIAVGEQKEREFLKAIQEQKKLEELLEESKRMLALAVDIYEKCERDGVVMLPLDC